MVLPHENTTARQANNAPEGSLDNVFLSPGIRLLDLDTQRAAQPTSSLPSSSRRVGEWVGGAATEAVETQDTEMKDAEEWDDDSKRTITVRDSSSPDKVDRSDAAATAGSKRSAGDFEGTASSWDSSAGKTDGSGATTEVARSKRSKRSADSEDTVTSLAASSSSGDADVSALTTRAGSKTSISVAGSGSTASASTTSTLTVQDSQGTSPVPAALDGTSDQRGSSSAGPSSNNNPNIIANNNNQRKPSIHDLSAASYLARHQAKTAQNAIGIPGSAQPAASSAPASASASSLPPSIVLSPPAEPKKKQPLIYENRALQNQLIETTFQQLWTRRENFLKFFTKAHGITLDINNDVERKKKGKMDDEDDADDGKRKDSLAIPSSSPAKTTTTTNTPQKPTLATSTPNSPANFTNFLGAARQRALELLLEAWYEKLGTRSTPSDGWTKYSEKTTTLAVLTLRSILSDGDTTLNVPISCLPGPRQVYWKHKLASVNFWFTSANDAVDFLSAFGIGQGKFGSEMSRIEVLQYSLENSGGKCLSAEHHASVLTWKAGVEHWAPNVFPPVRYCPCTEYMLLMKILAGVQKLPEPGSDASVKWISHRMVKGWQAANLQAGNDVEKGWPSEVGKGNLPLVFAMGGVPGFQVWHCLGRDEERSVLLRTIRLEGRFAELL